MFHAPKKQDISELPPEKPYQEIREDMVVHDRSQLAAPLFVKVEKYREVLADVQEMKAFIAGIKQLFGVLNELEVVRADTLKIMRTTVQRLEKSVIEMDMELLRPKGLEIEVQGEGEIRHIEDSLTDLHQQLATLKKELQELH